MATKRERCIGKLIKQKNDKDKGQAITFQYLDNCMLFNIFSRIPADVLVNNFMYQCRQWKILTSNKDFIKTNFHRSKQGIIFMEKLQRCSEERFKMKFMEMEGSELVEVRELHEFKTNLIIRSSCNGLLLIEGNRSYHVMNPVTKKSVDVALKKGKTVWCDLVFVPSAMEYRVVQLYCPNYYWHTEEYVLCIQTLDGCARHINIVGRFNIYENRRVSIDGVLYWDANGDTNHFIAFDLCTETFQTLQRPYRSSEHSCQRHLINWSGSLSLIEFVVDYSSSSVNHVNLWTLRDMAMGEWEKVFSFDRMQVRIGGEEFCPTDFVCAPYNGNVFIFKNGHEKLGAYDVKTKQWSLLNHSNYYFEDKNHWNSGHTVHINSLLPLDYK